MNLDETTIYAFIRQDLPPGQETIQAIHAAFHAGMAFGAEHGIQPGIPFAIATDTPTLKSVKKAQRKLEAAGVKHYAMVDTDVEEDVTAIITLPLDKVQKQILAEYRLRKYAPIAQLREQPELNREVVGENPAGCSISKCQEHL